MVNFFIQFNFPSIQMRRHLIGSSSRVDEIGKIIIPYRARFKIYTKCVRCVDRYNVNMRTE